MNRRIFIGAIAALFANSNTAISEDSVDRNGKEFDTRRNLYKEEFLIVRSQVKVDSSASSKILHGEIILAELRPPLEFSYTTNIVFSPNGQFFLCALIKDRRLAEKGGYTYRSAGFQVYRRMNSEWSLYKTILMEDFFPSDYRRIADVGAISDDGSIILVELGRTVDRDHQKLMVHDWETWDVAAKKLISRGLKV